jgi:hypothetical protein
MTLQPRAKMIPCETDVSSQCNPSIRARMSIEFPAHSPNRNCSQADPAAFARRNMLNVANVAIGHGPYLAVWDQDANADYPPFHKFHV